MSCDWDVYCIDCGESLGIRDANHALDEMRALAAHGDALADAAALLQEIAGVEVTVCYNKHLDLSWFAAHRGHAMRARDEYGHVDDECGQHFACACCDHRMQCRRAIGHEGDHTNQRDDGKAGQR